MIKKCAACPNTFEAKRPSAKFCSGKCRQRAHRNPNRDAVTEAVTPPPVDLPTPGRTGGSTESATYTELEAAGRLDSALGQAALVLARRLDNPHMETGSGLAALARQHGATLAEAVKDAAVAADPLDELRERRERKQHAG
jgi:hypothetical protein